MKEILIVALLSCNCCFADEIAPYWRDDSQPRCATLDQQHMIVTMEIYDRSKNEEEKKILKINLLIDIDCYMETLRQELGGYEALLGSMNKEDYPEYVANNVMNAICQLKLNLKKLDDLKYKLQEESHER